MTEHWRAVLAATRGGEAKYKILAQLVASDIDTGLLPESVRLPPQRQLAQQLGISVQTVTNAYKELEQQGLIRCQVGRGSFVTGRASERVAQYMLDHVEQALIDFSIVQILHTSAHDRAWRDTCKALARRGQERWMRTFRPIVGAERHREACSRWLDGLGLPASSDRLVLTNGATQARFLALAAVARAGDVVLSDSLSDHGTIGLAQVIGFTLKGLDTDEYGIQPDDFEDHCANERVTALVCTPNFNNPTGSLLPASRRRQIVRIAKRYGVYVVEDDVFGPLLTRRADPISAALPELGFYFTSFSKSVMTGLRLGCLHPPARLLPRVESILRVTSWTAPSLLAEVATRWIDDGTAAALLQVQRERLARRHALLHRQLGPWVVGSHAQALTAWLRAPAHWPLDALLATLRSHGIAVTAPDPFMVAAQERPQALRICLAADGSDSRINQALRTMASVFRRQPGAA